MNNYQLATQIYRKLESTTTKKNRKVKVAAIKRTLDKLSLTIDEGNSYTREELPILPKLILTYSNLTKFTDNDLRLIEDLSKYLNGEVGV